VKGLKGKMENGSIREQVGHCHGRRMNRWPTKWSREGGAHNNNGGWWLKQRPNLGERWTNSAMAVSSKRP